MLNMPDEYCFPATADQQPLLDDLDFELADPREGWVPMSDDFVTFMSDGRECPTCRPQAASFGGAPSSRLHVRLKGELLIVTHACDLHAPGEFFVARRLAAWPNQSLYQLASVPPTGGDLPMFRPAAGIALMSLGKGKRRLKAIGTIEGRASTGGCIVDAYEVRD